MKTITLILAGLTLHLSAAEPIDWAKRAKELNEENSRRFRERQFHDETIKQQERIHRESVIQRERIADDNRRQLERIERVIPEYRARDYFTPRPIFPIR